MAKNKAQNNAKFKTLDLHGFQTLDVEAAVDDFLHSESQRGTKKVKIMTGKGTGKVQTLVIQYLKRAKYPWSYEELPNGNKNTGVLVVHMD